MSEEELCHYLPAKGIKNERKQFVEYLLKGYTY